MGNRASSSIKASPTNSNQHESKHKPTQVIISEKQSTPTVDSQTWDLLYVCNYADWTTSISRKFGFNENHNKHFYCKSKVKETFCTNGFCLCKDNIQRLVQTTPTSGNIRKYLKKNSVNKIMDHFKYTALPAMFSSFHHYNVKSIVRGSDDVLLITIYSEITEKTLFVLIDLKTNKFKSIFGHYNGELSRSDVYAAWSHDQKLCLIRFNDVNNSSSHIHVYDISKRDGQLKNCYYGFSRNVLFSFDPTVWQSRLVFTHFYTDSSDTSLWSIECSSYNLKPLKSTEQSLVANLSRNSRDIQFTSDGECVILCVGDGICSCKVVPNGHSEVKYLIFAAKTCVLLKSYSSYLSTCTIHMCPNSYLPKLSQSYLALANKFFNQTQFSLEDLSQKDQQQKLADSRFNSLNRRLQAKLKSTNKLSLAQQASLNLTFVKVIKLPSDLKLKNLCRCVINQHLKSNSMISQLQLPSCLKDFLRYVPEFK